MPNDEANGLEHDHEPIVHDHRHHHVTHNYREMTGGFEHLSAEHGHEHDHAALSHSHHPHDNFEQEHLGEAHVHDHAEPVREDGQSVTAKPRKAAAKKTAGKTVADS